MALFMYFGAVLISGWVFVVVGWRGEDLGLQSGDDDDRFVRQKSRSSRRVPCKVLPGPGQEFMRSCVVFIVIHALN